MQTNAVTSGETEVGGNDLGPLAWVLDELKKSLDGATKAMRRFVRDAELARGSDLAALDASQLRIARQQLHQAVGALEMVGFSAPAKVMRVMESLAQKFVQRPELCSDDAAGKMERASFALTEYLEGVLKGKSASAVALFPQYRDVVEMVGAEKVHPSDLWPIEWSWIDASLPNVTSALAPSPAVRAQLDQSVLRLVKTDDVAAAAHLRDISLGLAAGQTALEPRVFWQICAGFFEAKARRLFTADVYSKRSASRVLLQYASLARGDVSVSDRLAQDLLFFCGQAAPAKPADAPVLAAVREAYHLTLTKPVNYETPQFGRFDPAVLVQARKRIATATETWSALAGGDTNRLKVVSDQFGAVADSILKLHPQSNDLAGSLLRAVEATSRSGEPPSTPVAMEVATAVLYLEAAYDDLDPTDTSMEARSVRLAQRLDQVTAGGRSEPLEAWMEELYRRVSDRQTMGSVVDELRTSLGEIEKSLDQFFRNPLDKLPLHEVPSQLAQMRGVFSVLGLDQASIATLRMRDRVEKLLIETVSPGATATESFQKLGSSLGALGFLIDMLGYQRAMAKNLFFYDEAGGEFKPVMGRVAPAHAQPVPPLASTSAVVAEPPAAALPVSSPLINTSHAPAIEPRHPVVLDAPVAGATAAGAAAAFIATANASSIAGAQKPVEQDDDDAEIRDIFLEEAAEVVQNGMDAVAALSADPSNLGEQTTLRRAFHTLKGSSRMVGLTEFGEAAWSMEQLLNAWLAEQKPATDALTRLCAKAVAGLGLWVGQIASRTDSSWSAQSFRQAADALRLENRLVSLTFPGSEEFDDTPATASKADWANSSEHDTIASELPVADETQTTEVFGASPDAPISVLPEFEATSIFDMLAPSAGEPHRPGQATPEAPVSANLGLDDLDFSTPAQQQDFEPTSFIESSFGKLATAPLSFEPSRIDLPMDFTNSLAPVAAPISAFQPIETSLPAATSKESDQSPPSTFEDSRLGQEERDETVKVIGSLRIGIPLYNVYLNEADEWSRRLLTELNEWSLELHRPAPASAVALAHSLSGSSATVGFSALSEIARALESALQHVQLHRQGDAAYAQVFIDSAEDIRRLLHQFAAGFLKEPDDFLLDALKAIVETEFSASHAGQLDDHDFSSSTETRPQELDEMVFPAPEPAGILLESSSESGVHDAVAPLDSDAPAVPVDWAPAPQLPIDVVPQDAALAGAPVVAAAAATALVGAIGVTSVALPAATLNIAPAQVVIDVTDDDIDAVDALDADLFPIFEEEALELLPQLGGALRQWTERPDNLSARGEVLRVLHTLKGSARLAGALRLGEKTHRMESSIEKLGSENLSAAQIDPLLSRFDDLLGNFESLRNRPAEEFALPEGSTHADAPDNAESVVEDPILSAPAAPVPLRMAPQAVAPTPQRTAGNQSVRVRSQLLDRLVNQAGEVMITRSRLEARLEQMRSSMSDLSGNLERLRHHLRDIEVQAESQMQSRMALAKETSQQFDPLEFDRFTRVQELTRMMAESVNDVATVQRNLQRTVEGTEDDLIAQGRQARGLQRDLLRTRMVEFEAISERLYGVVRQAAKDTGKQVKLDITGGSMDIDRGVLDRMAPAFEHLLRNSVAHGIESPEVRAAAGKPAAGSITIALQHQSNEVSVVFSDDGAGLDLPRIRRKAFESGVVSDAHAMSDVDAANLIFLPGFSTAGAVTEISGRGIGMDVVRSEMNALGGRIETSSVSGSGTRFNLVLPLTTAVTQVVLLRLGDLVVGVPASLIEIVRRIPAKELEAAYLSDTFMQGGEAIPFYWGGALLQASSHSNEMITKNLPVSVFRSAGQRIAAHVDEVLGNQEVVVKNLGPQLSRLPGLTGMSVLASGAVILIYNPVALASVYGEQAKALRLTALAPKGSDGAAQGTPVMPPMMAGVTHVPLIMVVDDSITVRRVTQRLLKREGYRVVMAADGLQALERLQDEKPTLVLSDIEMPRMDGFDLARNIRSDAKLHDIPIIMITSRIAEKHRKHARELGVDHYLGKPYAEDELLRLVRQYCAAATEA